MEGEIPEEGVDGVNTSIRVSFQIAKNWLSVVHLMCLIFWSIELHSIFENSLDHKDKIWRLQPIITRLQEVKKIWLEASNKEIT